jgi:alginate O-acetyltransferase complex protein AlgJ
MKSITDDGTKAAHRPMPPSPFLAIGFAAVIALPMFATALAGHNNTKSFSFEQSHEAPVWKWSPAAILRFPRAFREYFNNNFAFRPTLMKVHAFLKVRTFRVSSSSNVTLGKDGWLFYSGDGIVDSYRRTQPFSASELARWTELLVARRNWLEARGIPYLFLIAPDPQTIYPEQMPTNLWRMPNPSRLDQLMSYVHSHSDVQILDLRAALFSAKELSRIYYKTDTHWTQAGGFVAYQAIGLWMAEHFPSWRPDPAHEFDNIEIPGWYGALTYMLGAPGSFTETRLELVPRDGPGVTTDGRPLPQNETEDAWNIRDTVVREDPDGEIPRVVIFRDSQMAAPAQFLSRHFRRAVLRWQWSFDFSLVEKEEPNLVIQEMVERSLMGPIPGS